MPSTYLTGALLTCAAFATVTAAQAQDADAIAAKAAICSTCHGKAGVPVRKDIPIIWGQHAGYIFLNLRDFQTGARKNEQMVPIMATLSSGDMLALAEYFASKAWPDLEQPRATAGVTTHATAVAGSGQCTSCHQGGFLGDSTNPRLAGQGTDYLRKTMRDFHDGTRGNNPWMTALLKTFTDSDIDALAQFLGGL
jgi:cytochrome c553